MQRKETESKLIRQSSRSLLKRGSSFTLSSRQNVNEEKLNLVQRLLSGVEKRISEVTYVESELACELRSDLRTIIFHAADLLHQCIKIDGNFGARLKKCGKDLDVSTAELDLEVSESCVSPPVTPKFKP